MKLQDSRREYRWGKLTRDSLNDSPFDQFSIWMDQALEAGIQDPTAMTVSTVDATGRPWTRIVLLKGFDDTGFYFYTGYNSHKAQDIERNANVSLHFPWLAMDRQVIVGGFAVRVSDDQSRAYFATRPRESQIAARVADQSTIIDSREFLDRQFETISELFDGEDVPMPDAWGGYHVGPVAWEFWQGGEFRLHDRFRYEQAGEESWNITRLAP